MESFKVAANAVVPFIIYLLIGYLIRRGGKADRAFMNNLSKVIFAALFPFMMFHNMYTMPSGVEVKPVYGFTVFFSIIAVILVSIAIVPRIVKENARRGTIIQAIYRSNFIFFGLPMAVSVFGDSVSGFITMLLPIIIPTYNISAVIVLEMYRGGKVKIWNLIINILKNPMIIGIVIGAVFYLLQIKLPASVESTIGALSAVTTPLAIIALGGSLNFESIRHDGKCIAAVVSVKMVLLPLLALILGFVMDFSAVERFALFIAFASPIATASFPMAQNMGGDGPLAGELVAFSTVLSILTIFLWILGLGLLGLLY